MKAKCLPLDRISSLPRNIIESILCLMPIRDAVRTSILSRKWRYKWVNIPKLVFDEERMSNTRNLFTAIYHVLLLHHGPLQEFILSLFTFESCVQIDQIILHLLRKNTVKRLALNMQLLLDYKLPPSFFSLKQLTCLILGNCELSPPSTFRGFGSLKSLVLDCVKTTKKIIIDLISNCPLLKRFTLIDSREYLYLYADPGDSNIVDLFECLLGIEYLHMNADAIEAFVQGGIPRKLPTLLAHLKCINLSASIEDDLSFAFLLMRSSPKLEKIKIEIECDMYKSPQLTGLVEDYTDVCLDHLVDLEIISFNNFTSEFEFVKLILAKSRMLRRVHIEPTHIEPTYQVSSEQELKMLRSLLRLPRASPLAQIVVERR